MAGDPQSKNPRQFNCREYLWETFEQMSQEFDVSIDYLFNESLRQFAQSRQRGGPMVDQPEAPERASAPQQMGGYRPGMPPQQQQPMQRPGMQPMQTQQPMQRPGMPGMQPQQQGLSGQSGQRLPSMNPVPQRPGMPGMQPQQAQPQGRPGMPTTQPQQRPGMPGMGQPPPQQPAQRPPPPQQPPPQRPAPTQGRTLIALFEGQQYPVTKEEFVIGRGQKTTDLTIRDSNVSRRHASVVLYNNQYWIVDQQSTNGIDYNGGKVDRKVIEDGDSYRICDHEIQFVYR
jgi:hypothetical protein